MFKNLVFCFFISLAFASSAYAEGEWNFYLFRSESAINAQGQDIWWSQPDRNGVICFSKKDGKRTLFTVADGLVNGNVQAIQADRKGIVWFGTRGGISSFDGSTWKSYTTKDGLISDDVTGVTVDGSNTKWFGTKSGVSRFDGVSWRSYTMADGLADSTISCIYADAKGTIWTGTNGKGISCFDGKAWRTFTTRNGAVNDSINCIAGESDGTIWLATNAGVSRFDGISWESYTTDAGLADNEVFGVAVDKNDVKWFCMGKGVQRFDNDVWTQYSDLAGLDNWSVTVDEENMVWIGGSAIASFDGIEWLTYTPVANWQTWCVAIDRDDMKWFGYLIKDGVTSSKDFGWTRYTEKDGPVPDYVTSIVVDKNNVKWFTANNICSFDGSEWKTYTSSGGELHAQHAAVDSANVKWFTTGVAAVDGYWYGVGILSFDGVRWNHYSTADGVADSVVTSVAVDHDNVKWFGTDGKGVSSFDGKSWTSYTPDVLKGKRVLSIAVDHSNVKWFGTEGNGGGICSFDGRAWNSYDIEGLKGSSVSSLCVDRNNVLWIGTYYNKGIWSFDGNEWKKHTSDLFYPGLKYDVMDIAIDKNNVKWFIVTGIIASYDDNIQTDVEETPVPALFSVRGNYPNPFNPSTVISFSLPVASPVNLSIYSITGQKIATLVNGPISAGAHSVTFDGSKNASGVYFYRFESAGLKKSGKMLLLK